MMANKIRTIAPIIAGLFLFQRCSEDFSVKNDYEAKIIDNSLVNLNLLAAGSFQISTANYSLPAAVDPLVLQAPVNEDPVAVQVAGKIYLPIKNSPSSLVVFLHGNHATCGIDLGNNNPRLDFALEYTLTGECPEGFVPAPSYLGYEYAAKHLASHGIAVVSIDANRGITGHPGWEGYFDAPLIAARGNLVLRNLEYLKKLTQGTMSPISIDLTNKIDFSNVGLVGHSRGGEGVRAAYTIFRDSDPLGYWKQALPDLSFKGIFEIAPVDFGITGVDGQLRTYEANGVPWNLLLAGCDKDVLDFQGSNAYNRMLDFVDGKTKSIYTAWGANHNYFNTEWQVSDADECIGNQTALWNQTGIPISETHPELARPILDYYGVSQNLPMDFILNAIGLGAAREQLTGSESQRNIAKMLLLGFFKANLGDQPDAQLNSIFDPQFRLPRLLENQSLVSREFIRDDVAHSIFSGDKTAVSANGQVTVQTISEWVDESLDQVLVRINSSRANLELFEAPIRNGISLSWASVGEKTIELDHSDFDLSQFWTMDMVIGSRLMCSQSPCVEGLNPINFRVSLIDGNGVESESIDIGDYANIRSLYGENFFHYNPVKQDPNEPDTFSYIPQIMNTVRIELADFVWNATPSSVDKIKITVPAGTNGQLSLDEVYVVKR